MDVLSSEIGADVSAMVLERLELHTEHKLEVDTLHKQHVEAQAKVDRLVKELASFEATQKLQKEEDVVR